MIERETRCVQAEACDGIRDGPVLGVASNRMTNRCHLCANLILLARFEFDPHKCVIIAVFHYFVARPL